MPPVTIGLGLTVLVRRPVLVNLNPPKILEGDMITALEWLITLLGFTSTWLLAKRNRLGWIANAISQVVWLYVAAVTRQWPFVILSFLYGWLCWCGWRDWSEHRHKTE